MKKQIQSQEEIRLMVDTFYSNIRKDELLGPIFDKQIEDRWPEHLEKMYAFWGTILLGENSYSGHPFSPHAKLPVQKEHFNLWLKIFTTTIDDLFEGEVAIEAKNRGLIMATLFNQKKESLDKMG